MLRYHCWRKEYGGLKLDQAKRLKELGEGEPEAVCGELLIFEHKSAIRHTHARKSIRARGNHNAPFTEAEYTDATGILSSRSRPLCIGAGSIYGNPGLNCLTHRVSVVSH